MQGLFVSMSAPEVHARPFYQRRFFEIKENLEFTLFSQKISTHLLLSRRGFRLFVSNIVYRKNGHLRQSEPLTEFISQCQIIKKWCQKWCQKLKKQLTQGRPVKQLLFPVYPFHDQRPEGCPERRFLTGRRAVRASVRLSKMCEFRCRN